MIKMITTNIQELQELKTFLEKMGNIFGKEKLIEILEKYPSDGHIFHAEVVKLLFESKQFMITSIELSKKGKDIDIQVIDIKTKEIINIQCWHGNSFSTHETMRAMEKHKYFAGGVPPDWSKDEKVLLRKFKQLPDDKIGILLCYPKGLGDLASSCMLPELEGGFPKNKVLVELDNGTSEIRGAIIHAPSDFKEYDIIERIINSLKSTIRNKIEY